MVLSIILTGCGGESKSGRTLKDGRIFVWNDVGSPIKTSYLDDELGQVDTTIGPGETEEATRRAMKVGTTVKLSVEVPGQAWRPLPVDVRIDGNVTIRIYLATAWGSGGLEYEMR